MDAISTAPCVRSSLMWGIATGVLVGGHRFRTTKSVRNASDVAVLGFGAVAAASWFICKTAYNTRMQQTRQFMDVMNNPNHKAEAEQFLKSRIEPREEEGKQ